MFDVYIFLFISLQVRVMPIIVQGHETYEKYHITSE